MRQTQTTLTVAPLLLRTCAVLIDMAIVGVIGIALLAAAGEGSPSRPAYAAVMISIAIYYIGFTAAISASPGKIATGLYIADRRGARIRPDTAILRYVVYLAGY